jgi:very-short-patch-repair endonuclease
MPHPQATLLKILGPGWIAEIPVKTGNRRERGGMPTHYKIDIAHPDLKIAVEIDGESHSGNRKESDARKDAFLQSIGWSVLRFSNKAVIANSTQCAQEALSIISKSRARIPTSPKE